MSTQQLFSPEEAVPDPPIKGELEESVDLEAVEEDAGFRVPDPPIKGS